MRSACLFCGGDASEPDHLRRCDGRQGAIEAPPEPPPAVVGPHFSGATYEPALDHARLTKQMGRVFDVLADARWRTLAEIEAETGDPQASISARIRDLRKKRFGGFSVERRRRGDETRGLFEYRVLREEPAYESRDSGEPCVRSR